MKNAAMVVSDGIELSRHERRELAWRLRHQSGWPLTRIAARLGVKVPAVSRLLRREACLRSIERLPIEPPVDPTRRHLLRPLSLSALFIRV